MLALPAHAQSAAPFQMQDTDLKDFAEGAPVPGPFQVTEADVQAATEYVSNQTAGTASLTQNTDETLVFRDNSSADAATIVNNEGGATRFYDAATAGTNAAFIANNGVLQFSDNADAGAATIVTNAGGAAVFTDDANAGTANIENNGTTVFLDRSSIGDANLTNNGSGQLHLAGQSDAGNGFTNNGLAVLSDQAGLGAGATSFVSNNATGRLLLRDEANAGGGTISNSGTLVFTDQARAGTAGIVNNQTGVVAFIGQSSADSSQRITNAGQLYFGENATAGTALIQTQTGAQTIFYGAADGALSQMEVNAGGTLDFSLLDTAGTSVGWLESRGQVALGSKVLTVGGDNSSSEAHGIVDGGLGGGSGGSLVKVGTGTLRLGGTNSYTGLTRIEAGILQAASTDAFAPQSGVVIAAGAMLDLAGSDQTIGSLAGEGEVELADNTLTLGGDDSSTEFSGSLLANGGITKVGSGTLTLSGTNTNLGASRLVSGGLQVDGTMVGSALTVEGGVLSGSGTVGGTEVLAGGTINPGNGANLTIASDLILNAGATYRIDITQAGSDSITVLGSSEIDGANLEIGQLTLADPTGTYVILASTGPISGQFTFDPFDYAFLLPSLDYEANAVALTIARNGLTFSDVAATPNQRATAQALEGFSPTDPIFAALLTASVADARRSYDLASGEVHAAGPLLAQRALDLFTASLGTGLGVIDMGPDGSLARGRAWIAPMGTLGMVAGDGNGAKIDWSAAGLAAGAEVLAEHADGHGLVGLGVGYLASEARLDDRLSTLTAHGAYAGLYGQWRDGPLWLDGTIAYGATQNTTRRDIIVGSLTRTANARYRTQALGAALEARYEFELARNFHIGPVARLDMGWTGHSGASETGAGSLDQTLSATDAWRFDTGLGLAGRYDIPLADGGAVSLSGKALWQHALADAVVTQTTSLAGGGGAFEVAGPVTDRDRLRLIAGVSYRPNPDLSLSLDYAATLGGVETSHAARFALRVRF